MRYMEIIKFRKKLYRPTVTFIMNHIWYLILLG